MKPIEHFQFCPRCGERRAQMQARPRFQCHKCGFTYYFNPAIGAAAFLLNGLGQYLFIRRAREPQQGKLAIPGGFIDAGETAEDALRREIREEVNLEVSPLRYLASHPNDYLYRDVTYSVLDLFFVAQVANPSSAAALDGVDSYCWLKSAEVDRNEIAFPSIRIAFEECVSRMTSE